MSQIQNIWEISCWLHFTTNFSDLKQNMIMSKMYLLFTMPFYNVLAEPPRILTSANTLYQVIANRPALLDCAFFGSPRPTIEW